MLVGLGLYLVTINLAAFLVFAWDKHVARTGGWRVRESSLLTLAFVGGSIGAITGQQLLRHKTRKEPFRTLLWLIAAVQPAGALAAWFYLTGG